MQRNVQYVSEFLESLGNNDIECLSTEQMARLDCGCGSCIKLFKASQRWMQGEQERTQELEQMSIAELQLQLKFLLTQLSTVIQLVGEKYIVDSRDRRQRTFELRCKNQNRLYTQKFKLIDDVNELCLAIK